MVVVFFVTSADSGALVVDMLASSGKGPLAALAADILVGADGRGGHRPAPRRWPQGAANRDHRQRAAILHRAPGVDLGPVQGAAPGCHQARHPLPGADFLPPHHAQRRKRGDGWQRRLRNIAMFPRRSHVNRFITDVARPASGDVAAELRKQGY